MVLMNNFAPQYIDVKSQYFLQNIPHAINDCYCRAGVAEKLLQAAKKLQQGYKFLIWDAWRPVAVQTALFDMHKAILQKSTGLSGGALSDLAQKYVSLPSTYLQKPSTHLTGGAVDLTIIDPNGKELNMGTGFDHFGDEAQTDFYESKPGLQKNEATIRQNRRLLFNLLTSVGFTNYPHEWWHFDYGNQFWAVQLGKEAIYNLTKPQL